MADRPITESQRILLRHREEVAQATERAGRDLHKLGIDWEVTEQLLVGGRGKDRSPNESSSGAGLDPLGPAVQAAIDRAADRLMARLESRFGARGSRA